MITLAWPWILLALPLPWLARWLPPARDEVGAALRFPIRVGLGTESAGHPPQPSGWRRWRRLIGLIAWGVAAQNWWGAIGIIPLFTAAIGWCPAYLPFGISSCKTGK